MANTDPVPATQVVEEYAQKLNDFYNSLNPPPDPFPDPQQLVVEQTQIYGDFFLAMLGTTEAQAIIAQACPTSSNNGSTGGGA